MFEKCQVIRCPQDAQEESLDLVTPTTVHSFKLCPKHIQFIRKAQLELPGHLTMKILKAFGLFDSCKEKSE